MNDIDRQKQIEADAVRDGCLRWCRSTEYQLATDTRPVRDLIGNSLKSLADAIQAEQEALRTSPGTRLPNYGVALLSLNPEQLALITLSILFVRISQSEFETCMSPRLTPVAYDIGQRCRIERLYDLQEKRGVNLADQLRSRNRSAHAGRRAAELARKFENEEDWAKNFRSYHLGAKLIAMAFRYARFEGQPIFELKQEQEKNGRRIKTIQRVALTTAAEDWIAEQSPDALELFSPVYVPMIVSPRPWTSISEGGYLNTPMRLLKRQIGKRAQQKLEKADLSAVFSAVNVLQETAFRINKDIDRSLRQAWPAWPELFGVKLLSFDPTAELEPEPQSAADEFKWEQQLRALYKVMGCRLAQAAQLGNEAQFYFPHQVDHRGRAYPVPQLMNPQSDDIGRAQIEFAEGKPLGERGEYWLAIHIANCYWKGSKVSFDRRRAWVQQNEDDIIAFANIHRAHRFWTEADKPWLFLAACNEWKRYKEQGPQFLSHLPVCMDGSCNGYQHLSAMGLDRFGGAATNLMAAGEPADIYQRVADLVNQRIARDAAKGGANADAARELLGKIDRDVVKPATMTTPYGVTLHTIYKELLEKYPAKDCKDPRKCAMYLARLLQECIPVVVVEAGRIMKWLRKVAGILAKKNRGMAWTAPTGFLVIHESREPKPVRVATADHTFLLYQEDEKQKIAQRKQVDGIVPHLVHSFDAAHMMRTSNRLKREGIHHVAMVHDSFGVHAADVDRLNVVLREEFVGIYSEPVLKKFLDELRKANPDVDLPDFPQTGTLDIREVLSSPYFFA